MLPGPLATWAPLCSKREKQRLCLVRGRVAGTTLLAAGQTPSVLVLVPTATQTFHLSPTSLGHNPLPQPPPPARTRGARETVFSSLFPQTLSQMAFTKFFIGSHLFFPGGKPHKLSCRFLCPQGTPEPWPPRWGGGARAGSSGRVGHGAVLEVLSPGGEVAAFAFTYF